jgi:hypothetical protein
MKRLKFYEWAVALFFMINIMTQILHDFFSFNFETKEVIDYMFWFSLGLYLGFQLFKFEIKRISRKNSAGSNK